MRLHAKRMKPLLLFTETAPALQDIGSFVQWSGARFLLGNDTYADSSAVAAQNEVEAFVNVPFSNTHPIVSMLVISKGRIIIIIHGVYSTGNPEDGICEATVVHMYG